jgi:hypothetical protein
MEIIEGRVMKKLFLILSLLVVMVGAGAVYLLTNLDSIAKRAIESAGSNALGTAVRVESVSIDLIGGSATLSGFTVANPAGFSSQDMIKFDELRVAIDTRSLNADVIRINSIASVNPYVLFEMSGGRSNFDAIRERFPPQEPLAESVEGPVIAINEIVINGIQGAVLAEPMPRAVNVNLGNVSIPSVEGTPEVLARQIARPLLTQLARNATAALGQVTAEALESELMNRADDAVEELRSQTEEAARNLRERLGL